MDKNIKKFIVLTIVLLNTLYFSADADAGFYDWLTSKESANSILVQPMTIETTGSFEKIFWNTKKTEELELVSEEPKVEYEVVRESFRQVTAYNVGDIYQTDSTPCIGAYPKVDLCEEVERGVRVCAANFVPLNTVLRIVTDEESFECIVWDRMASRFSTRVDIAMNYSEKAQAKQFGLQNLKVQILSKVENEISI